MDARSWNGEDERDFDILEDEDGPCLYCEADAGELCEVGCQCAHCTRMPRGRWSPDQCAVTPGCAKPFGHGGLCESAKRMTRQERLQALADSGCDIWEEYRGER